MTDKGYLGFKGPHPFYTFLGWWDNHYLVLRLLLQNKNYHSLWHKPVQISGRDLCFFIYSSVHTNFGDQIIIQNYVGIRLLFQGILSLICTIHILEISTFDNTVQLHEVLVCNEVMFPFPGLLGHNQRYTYRVLQTIQMKLILLCVWAEQAVLGSARTALKFIYEI